MKRAIIIGASSGLGLSVTRQLIAQGWQVGIAARRIDRLNDLKAESPNVVAVQQIDVTADDAPERLLDLFSMMDNDVDLYFHSSGVGHQNVELDIQKELETVNTNALGVTRMVVTAFNFFAARPERKAQIAVISSIARTKGLGASPAYSSTKRFVSHYLECLTQLTAIRRLPHITITDIRPGFVRTPLIEGGSYPMQLDVEDASRLIIKGVLKGKSIVTVDWRYRLLVWYWQLIPRWIWVRLRIVSK